jgi:hypothetical protein
VRAATRLLLGFALLCALAAADAPAAGAAVVLNEINCEGTDWVELVNTGADPADISGWLLTDGELTATDPKHRMLFAAGTVIPANGDLVVEKGDSGFAFGISCGSDTIRLADGASAPVDDIAVPALASGADTWGRYPNATGSWVETVPTKGDPNEAANPSGGPPPDQAAWLFDPGAVVEINLTLPQASKDALAANPDEYQDATFSLTTTGGTYGPLAVGARLKGGYGSFRPLTGKSAFKIKFAHSVAGQRFLGLKKLTLNNMVQDPSMVHETLAYDAFRAVGVPAPRTGYAYVRVNGDDYGVYLNVEALDDVSLPKRFDSTQHLYEGAYGVDVSPGNAGAFEVDEGSESDRSDLDALIAAVNDTDGDWSDGLAATADLGEMTHMWAMERYICHWDGYAGTPGDSKLRPNNYYLHSGTDGRFSMLPWGTDQTWSKHLGFRDEVALLFDKCLRDASCDQMYSDAVAQARSAVGSLDLGARATATAAVLAPWQEKDPRKEYSTAAIAQGVSDTLAFLASRPADLDPALPAAPGGSPPPPLPLGGSFKASEMSAATIRGVLKGHLHDAAGRLRRLGLARLARRQGLRLKRLDIPAAGVVKLGATCGRVPVLRAGGPRLRLTAAGRRLVRQRRRLALRLSGSFTSPSGRVIHIPSERVVLSR